MMARAYRVRVRERDGGDDSAESAVFSSDVKSCTLIASRLRE